MNTLVDRYDGLILVEKTIGREKDKNNINSSIESGIFAQKYISSSRGRTVEIRA